MITLFDKFFKDKNTDKYIVYFTYLTGKYVDNFFVTIDELNTDVLSSSRYYNEDSIKYIRIFNENEVIKYIKKFSKRYNYYKFYYMKYEDFLLDISTNKYNL